MLLKTVTKRASIINANGTPIAVRTLAMRNTRAFFCIAPACALAVLALFYTGKVWAGENSFSQRSGFITEFYVTGSLPVGPWTNHYLAGTTTGDITHPDNLKQYGPGLGGGLGLGYAFRNRVSLTLQANLTSSSTSEWEEYAQSVGSDLSAWASIFHIHCVVHIGILSTSPYQLTARIGAGLTDVGGKEYNRDEGVEYDYGNFGASVSFRLGIENVFFITDQIACLLLLDGIGAFPGKKHHGQSENQPYYGFSASLGLRVYFGTQKQPATQPGVSQ